MPVVIDLLEKAFVRRVHRMDIRIVRFCRSANDVLTCFGSGLPMTFSYRSRCRKCLGTWRTGRFEAKPLRNALPASPCDPGLLEHCHLLSVELFQVELAGAQVIHLFQGRGDESPSPLAVEKSS